MAAGVEFKSWYFLILSAFVFMAAGRAMDKSNDDDEPWQHLHI